MVTTPAPEPQGGVAPEVLAEVAGAAAADSGGLDPGLLGDFLPSLAGAVAAGRRLPRPQLHRCRARGEQAARAGIALPALLDLYLSAGWRLWRRLPVVQSAADHPEAVVTGAEVMLHAVDDAVAALGQGYQRARHRLIREQESQRRELIDDLLSGGAEVGELVERASGVGLDLSGPHAVAVVESEQPLHDGSRQTDEIDAALRRDTGRHSGTPSLVASKSGRLVVVFAAPEPSAVDELTEALTAVLGPSAAGTTVDLRRRIDLGTWHAAVGRARPGPIGVRASYEEARSTLELATRLNLPARRVVHASDLLAYQVLLRDRAAISDLVGTVLTPLQQARGGAQPLLDTLAAYFDAGGNAAGAARALHLSVRALTYRLERVHRLTGLDPASPAARFTLHAAVLGATLLDWPGTPLT